MDPAANPFAPGAGNQPPELAGREEVLRESEIVLKRVIAGTPDRGMLLLGLRGVGKTVLLNRVERQAAAIGYETVAFEASERSRLAEMLAPRLKAALLALSRWEGAREKASRGLGKLRAFASAFRVSIGGVDIQVTPADESADTGDLEIDLPELLVSVGTAAQAAERGVALLIDELQYLSDTELAALIAAMHRLAQRNLPVLLFGAGLPQLAGLAGDAKSYAERLFRYPRIDRLGEAAAAEAILEPLRHRGVSMHAEAIAAVVTATQGYPYFLQEWGYHAWNVAADSPITLLDVERAGTTAVHQLDSDFFRVRFDRLTPLEKEYMLAMAQLGPGPHASGSVARQMGRGTAEVGAIRERLIRKGMAYSPAYGKIAFTVPVFDRFMLRVMA